MKHIPINRELVKESWKGSSDPNDLSGIATFVVNSQEFSFKLENFNDFQKIGTILDIVSDMISYRIKSRILNKIEKVIKEN
jgi:hypothetical protein